MTRRVLVVDDDAAVREALGQTLELSDLDAQLAGSFVVAKDFITPDFDGVILSDIRMPGRDGFHLLEFAHGVDKDLPVILLTGEGDIPMAVRAMGQGAFDFLEKPCAPEDLVAVLERALKTRALVLENRRLRQQVERGDAAARLIYGESGLAEKLRERVRMAARSVSEVLVMGAPGTGVSKVAEVIHMCSDRSAGPFVKRPAAGLTPEALTEAVEASAGGSLFLDEIGQLPPDAQFALAEKLDQGSGLSLIAGSTMDLEAAAEDGQLYAELFYHLQTMVVRIPAISERREDIPVLFRHYVAQASEQAGLEAPEIPQDVLAGLMAQDWPGNTRALMSAAMRFVLGMPEESDSDPGLGLAEQMAQVERSLLINALRRHRGRASAAAEALKLPRKTLYDRLSRYGLRPEDYRA